MAAVSGRFVSGTVVSHKEWSNGLYSLLVDAPIDPFIAGQFTQLALDDDQILFRPYSLVNAPKQTPLEFYYSKVAGGKLTARLVELVPGDRLFVAKRPGGRFILSAVQDANILWLFATGTGLGVFLSMLQTAEPWQRFAKIVLVHSVQKAASLTHQALIESWIHQYPAQFCWLPTVTGERYHGQFSLRVTELLSSGELERVVGSALSAESSQTMLCGNPAMVNDLSALLIARGLSMNHAKQHGHISIENYWKLI